MVVPISTHFKTIVRDYVFGPHVLGVLPELGYKGSLQSMGIFTEAQPRCDNEFDYLRNWVNSITVLDITNKICEVVVGRA